MSEPSATMQYIVFTVDGYFLALPSQYVLKVVAAPPVKSGGMLGLNLVQLGQYSIQLLNLAEMVKLQEKSVASTNENTVDENVVSASGLSEAIAPPPFLMVLQSDNQQLFGIRVDAPPDLIEIPANELKPIPKAASGRAQMDQPLSPLQSRQRPPDPARAGFI